MKDKTLPSKGKHSTGAYAFIEGVCWTLDAMIGYKCIHNDIQGEAVKKALELYPD